jgi:tetratricopeptide (TPR) repeat protein
VDVDSVGDRIVVLDSTAETIEVFSVTDYGRALMNAVEAQYNYDYATAEGYWREALSYNQNLFIAYSGIGRAMLRSGDADGALYYLKLGDDRKYYSKALEKVRNEKLKEYLVPVALTLIGLLIALKIVKALVRRSKEKRQTA